MKIHQHSINKNLVKFILDQIKNLLLQKISSYILYLYFLLKLGNARTINTIAKNQPLSQLFAAHFRQIFTHLGLITLVAPNIGGTLSFASSSSLFESNSVDGNSLA